MDTFLLLPSIRGYLICGRSDILAHAGAIKDIILYGHTSDIIPLNIYPILHILLAQMSLILNLDPMEITNYAIPLFYLLYLLGTYLLAKICLSSSSGVALATLASTALMIHQIDYQVLPNAASIMMLPLLFYCYIRSFEKTSFAVLTVILIVLYPFLHPITSILIIIFFAIMEFLKVLFVRFQIKREFPISSKISMVPLISFIALILWLWHNYYFWNIAVITSFDWLTGKASWVEFIKTLSAIQEIRMSSLEAMWLFLKLYGHHCIYLTITIIALVIVMKKISSIDKYTEKLLYLSGLLVLSAVFSLLRLFYFPSLPYGYWRFFTSGIVLTPIFVSFTFNEVFEKNYLRLSSNTFALFLSVLFLCSLFLSIFSFYPSPITKRPNHPVVQHELIGMKWFYEYKDRAILTDYVRLNTRNLVLPLYGVKEVAERRDMLYYRYGEVTIAPDHFSYLHGEGGNDTYLVISLYDKLFYTKIYPELEEFSETDFEKLNRDPFIDRLYSNGEFEVYKIRAILENKRHP
jgi:hypothetical protein